MKLLVGLSNDSFKENTPYRMYIVDTDVIPENRSMRDNNWKEIDINELSQCANIKVDVTKFQSNVQSPFEYISGNFDVEKIIGAGRSKKDFQITNIYYDDQGQPQLYRVVHSDGLISMHDISEFSYRKANSILGKTIEELPDFVKKEPLTAAYEWWKAKDEKGKKSESRFFSGQFEAYESMPVKLLYHYLTGVKGFKVGYHTQTEISEDYSSEIQHEYFLYKDTANIKLRESIPTNEGKYDFYSFGGYDMFGREKDPYPDKRQLKYYGATMSMICTRENYPSFNMHTSHSSQGSYDKDGLDISINYRNGLMHIYNKLEANGCISKDWRLGEYNSFFGMTDYALLPEELALLSVRLQSEKEGTIYGHAMSATHGHWSTFNTDQWIKVSALALATQFYSPELMEKLKPIFQNYQTIYTEELRKLIEEMGAKDALETMKWTKEASKEVLKSISSVRADGTIQKSNTDIVDQMSNLYTYKRNNYPLPDWLQIYSPETIEALGGVNLLQELISKRGEQKAKEAVSILAEGIESEKRYELLHKRERFIKPDDIISEEPTRIEAEQQSENTTGMRR